MSLSLHNPYVPHGTRSHLRLSQTSCQFWVPSCQLPVPMADKWSSVDLFVNLYWTGFFSCLFMSFSCILWHFQHMLCHNKKPHLTLFSPLPYPLFPPSRIINAVILCIFNSITSALPHWKWTSLSLSLSLCVSDRGPSSSCRACRGLIHFVALCDSLGLFGLLQSAATH